MLKVIVIIVVALLAGVLLFAATKPDSFRVERSALIKAPPEKIFPYINDFNAWRAWSPYEKLDPGMQRTLSGAPAGKGAVYAWEGNSKVGKGRMEILESAPPSKIVIQLDFAFPMDARNIAEFTLVPEGDSTRVTWQMSGPAAFLTKVMQVFVNMDTLIGKDFAAGLATLKTVTES